MTKMASGDKMRAPARTLKVWQRQIEVDRFPQIDERAKNVARKTSNSLCSRVSTLAALLRRPRARQLAIIAAAVRTKRVKPRRRASRVRAASERSTRRDRVPPMQPPLSPLMRSCTSESARVDRRRYEALFWSLSLW